MARLKGTEIDDAALLGLMAQLIVHRGFRIAPAAKAIARIVPPQLRGISVDGNRDATTDRLRKKFGLQQTTLIAQAKVKPWDDAGLDILAAGPNAYPYPTGDWPRKFRRIDAVLSQYPDIAKLCHAQVLTPGALYKFLPLLLDILAPGWADTKKSRKSAK